MTHDNSIDPEVAWSAVLARDRRADGRFVTGVLSTGIYCRPSCAARHPKRANVRFYVNGAAARMAGLRPCLRCRPDEVASDTASIAKAVALIEAAEAAPSLAELAEAAGYSAFISIASSSARSGSRPPPTPAAYAPSAPQLH